MRCSGRQGSPCGCWSSRMGKAGRRAGRRSGSGSAGGRAGTRAGRKAGRQLVSKASSAGNAQADVMQCRHGGCRACGGLPWHRQGARERCPLLQSLALLSHRQQLLPPTLPPWRCHCGCHPAARHRCPLPLPAPAATGPFSGSRRALPPRTARVPGRLRSRLLGGTASRGGTPGFGWSSSDSAVRSISQ